MTLEAYLSANYGISLEDFETDALDYAYDCVENDLCFRAIVEKEDLGLTGDEYSLGLAEYYASYGKNYFDTVKEFEDNYGHDYLESSILWSKLLNWLVENNTFNMVG